jgi:hypothetical protein
MFDLAEEGSWAHAGSRGAPSSGAGSRPDSLSCSNREAYALRRTLVRRLQAASRGVSRRTRFEQHKAFAREWEEYRWGGRLGVLQQAVAGERPVLESGTDSAGLGLLLTLALVSPEVAEPKSKVAGVEGGLACSETCAGSVAVSGDPVPADSPRQPSQAQPGVLQADLFGPGFLAQPL